MPVWYAVEKILAKKSLDGVTHYKIKWLNYSRPSWEPFYNVSADLIGSFESARLEKQRNQRQNRYNTRCIKREMGWDYEETIPIPGRPPKSKKRKW